MFCFNKGQEKEKKNTIWYHGLIRQEQGGRTRMTLGRFLLILHLHTQVEKTWYQEKEVH